tara:strand:+ start:44 stop:568 length:525 start_codon:yes stop_codon:yes gene_type:complete
MKIIINEKGYSAKEWKDKETSGREKHRVYIVGPKGEIGYLDLKGEEFVNSSNNSENFGIVDEKDAKVSLKSKSNEMIFVGPTLTQQQILSFEDTKNDLHEYVKRYSTITEGRDNRVDITIGPSVELKHGGRSHWAKANMTVSINDPDDIMELYEVVSGMAACMLDLEIDKLRNR